jgi:hypothetical protein
MKTTFFDTYNTSWHHSHTADLAPEAQLHQSFRETLADAWQGLLNFLTKSGDEPRIWISHTATGEPCWNAYDPITGRRLYAATENDVLVWLEKRYNYQ